MVGKTSSRRRCRTPAGPPCGRSPSRSSRASGTWCPSATAPRASAQRGTYSGVDSYVAVHVERRRRPADRPVARDQLPLSCRGLGPGRPIRLVARRGRPNGPRRQPPESLAAADRQEHPLHVVARWLAGSPLRPAAHAGVGPPESPADRRRRPEHLPCPGRPTLQPEHGRGQVEPHRGRSPGHLRFGHQQSRGRGPGHHGPFPLLHQRTCRPLSRLAASEGSRQRQ